MSSTNDASSLHPHPIEMANQAHLVYINGEQAGYLRVRRGRGFAYRDPDGNFTRDEEFLQRVNTLSHSPSLDRGLDMRRSLWAYPGHRA